jgi:hypothetical protein
LGFFVAQGFVDKLGFRHEHFRMLNQTQHPSSGSKRKSGFGRRSSTNLLKLYAASSNPVGSAVSSPIPSTKLELLPASNPPVVTDYNWFRVKASEAGNFSAVMKDWERRRRRLHAEEWSNVLKAFQDARYEILYRLPVAMVDDAIKQTAHALGTVRQDEAKKHPNVANASPAYPTIMLFYNLVEQTGVVPSWQVVERYLFAHPDLCLKYYFMAAEVPYPSSIDELWEGEKNRAIRYRIAGFYYAFLKEIRLLAELREAGFDARYHPLLDAEWKADILVGSIRIELFLENEGFKAENTGRKKKCISLNPGLPVVEAPMERKKLWGRVWVYDRKSVVNLMARIQAEMDKL